jgi:hypothetical protein
VTCVWTVTDSINIDHRSASVCCIAAVAAIEFMIRTINRAINSSSSPSQIKVTVTPSPPSLGFRTSA